METEGAARVLGGRGVTSPTVQWARQPSSPQKRDFHIRKELTFPRTGRAVPICSAAPRLFSYGILNGAARLWPMAPGVYGRKGAMGPWSCGPAPSGPGP